MAKYELKGRPFDTKGAKNVEDCKTAEEVINKAGLNWDVEKVPIYAKASYANSSTGELAENLQYLHDNDGNIFAPINGLYSTIRTDMNYPLGIVTKSYEIVQNDEAFAFFNKAIGKNKAIWQTAGTFGNGQRIFVSAKLPNNITIKGDPIDNYLVFTNNHDGTGGVRILFTPIRVICQNTLNAAIRNSTNYVSYRHSSKVHDNIDVADQILGICNDITDNIKEEFTKLTTINISDDKAAEIFAKVILDNKDIQSMKEQELSIKRLAEGNVLTAHAADISTRKFNSLYKLNEYYHEGIGQKEIEGTAWGVYNAVTGYFSNVNTSKDDKRMDSLLYGNMSKKIKEVSDELLAIA